MDRFILRFCGSGRKPPDDVARIRSLPNTTVIDDSTSRMVLVEGREAELKAALRSLSDWVMSKEEMVPLPNPRPKLREAP
jgi:hypothetical protein